MKIKKIAVLIGTAVLTMSLFTGCSGKENSNAQTEQAVTNNESTNNEGTNGEAAVEDGAIILQVTAIDGNTITGDLGTFAVRPRGERPEGAEMPEDGGRPEDGEMPEGESLEVSEMPEGERPEGGMPGGGFQATGESTTFVIEDTATITVQAMQESQPGSLEDIVVGSMLVVTMDENDVVTSVVVRNFTPNNGFNGGAPGENGTEPVLENTETE